MFLAKAGFRWSPAFFLTLQSDALLLREVPRFHSPSPQKHSMPVEMTECSDRLRTFFVALNHSIYGFLELGGFVCTDAELLAGTEFHFDRFES